MRYWWVNQNQNYKQEQAREGIMRLFTRTMLMLVVVMDVTPAPLSAQWSKYPTPGAPRTPTGDVDLSAATPRLANGKPDLSGIWMTADPACGRVGGPASASQLLQLAPPSQKCSPRGPTMSREGINMGV